MTRRAPSPSGIKLAPALRELIRPYRWRLSLVGVGVLIAATLDLVGPLAIRRLVDNNLVPRQTGGLAAIAVVYVAALVAGQIVTAAYSYLAATAAQHALVELRTRLFSHLLELPTAYHDSNPSGEGVARATADIDTIDDLFSSSAAAVLGETIRLVTVTVTMLLLSPALTGVAALAVPPLALLTSYVRRRVRDAERATRMAVGEATTMVHEDVIGVDVIRAHARQPAFADRFRRTLLGWLGATNRSTRYNSVYAPALAMLSAGTTAALLWVGGRGAAEAIGISIGTLTAFVLLFARFFAPLINLGDEWQSVQSALAGAERVFAVLAIAPDRPPVDRPRPTVPGPREAEPIPAIELRGVTFGYQAGRPVLHDISLTVDPGEHVAIVGRSGAGKSSMLALLAGLYPLWTGWAALLGLDPYRLDDATRRALIGYVPQTPHLFAGTIFDNLTFGDTSYGVDEVHEAARIAGAHDFIAALPDGYLTSINDEGRGGGRQLSGGQRQLIALARALVSGPRVLLLDEATAVVDAATDAAFRTALNHYLRRTGAAAVTIAHRLSTAIAADRVLVVASGRVVEAGTPAQLDAAGGYFSALTALERAGWDWH